MHLCNVGAATRDHTQTRLVSRGLQMSWQSTNTWDLADTRHCPIQTEMAGPEYSRNKWVTIPLGAYYCLHLFTSDYNQDQPGVCGARSPNSQDRIIEITIYDGYIHKSPFRYLISILHLYRCMSVLMLGFLPRVHYLWKAVNFGSLVSWHMSCHVTRIPTHQNLNQMWYIYLYMIHCCWTGCRHAVRVCKIFAAFDSQKQTEPNVN